MSSPTSPTRDNQFATTQPTAHVAGTTAAAPHLTAGTSPQDESPVAGPATSPEQPNPEASDTPSPSTSPAGSQADDKTAPTTETTANPAPAPNASVTDNEPNTVEPADALPPQQDTPQASTLPPQAVVLKAAETTRAPADADTAPSVASKPEQTAASPPQASAPRLLLDADMPACEAVPLACGEAVVLSQKCPGKETANEDGAVVIPVGDRGVVLAVADGVGGLPQGDQAARVVLETLIDFVSRNRNPERLRVAIIDAIEKANRRVIALGGGAATTLSVVQIIDQRVRTYHVGDSEIFVVGGRGMIKLQTLAHGPVAYGVHCGLIDPAEALLHESRNLVSNIVGAHDMRIELGPSLKLAQRDVVLICSDGITDNLHAEEIATTICGKPTEAAGGSLLDALKIRREQMGELDFKDDDSTFVIYRRGKSATS